MKMRVIPPGEFLMGSPQAEIETLVKSVGVVGLQKRFRSEGPQHRVTLTKPFSLGMHEVTQAQYEQVMGNNPFHHSANGPGKRTAVGLDTGKFPVENLTWLDAVDFCIKLSEREGLRPCYRRDRTEVTMLDGNGYRLPTEAEWEFACRAGTQTRWSFGDDEQELPHFGWIGSNSDGRTRLVGTRRKNGFGLHDMYGNVWEFCQDVHATYGREEAITNPLGPASEFFRPIRGGSFGDQPMQVRSANRGAPPLNVRRFDRGFRLAISVGAAKVKPAALTDPDRAVAEWLLGIGGTCLIGEGNSSDKVNDVDQLPNESFKIMSVELNGNQEVMDDDLKRLKGLTKLTHLNLVSTQVGDTGLEHLKGLTNLSELVLDYAKITGTGLKHLTGLVNLRILRLNQTQVTDEGIVHLSGLANLMTLTLSSAHVTDTGLEHL
jgi:formylglycine-generating enzyme required for sulfatase activity